MYVIYMKVKIEANSSAFFTSQRFVLRPIYSYEKVKY
jgi:hypothetical protein